MGPGPRDAYHDTNRRADTLLLLYSKVSVLAFGELARVNIALAQFVSVGASKTFRF